MKKQIFISYRRNGGEVMAHTLNEKLIERGYEVFYDIESLKSGAFNTKLYEEIEACEDFILILPKDGLINCRFEEDWVRREIAHALKLKKNIVSVFLRDFTFPNDLPDEIYEIKNIQGVDFSTMDDFESKVDRIIKMLHSQPIYSRAGQQATGCKIKRVLAYGVNGDTTNPPEKMNQYNIIELDKYEKVVFRLDVDLHGLSMPEYKLVIVDSEGFPIFDNSGIYSTNENMNEVVLVWRIKEKGYPMVAPGRYRASITIENTEQFFMGVEICLRPTSENEKKRGPLGLFVSRTVTNVETHLSYRKGGRLALFYGILLYLTYQFALPYFDDIVVGALLCIIAFVIAFLKLLKYSRKYILRPRIVLIPMLLFPITAVAYCVYLLYKAYECKRICKNRGAIERKIKELTRQD